MLTYAGEEDALARDIRNYKEWLDRVFEQWQSQKLEELKNFERKINEG